MRKEEAIILQLVYTKDQLSIRRVQIGLPLKRMKQFITASAVCTAGLPKEHTSHGHAEENA